LRCWFEFCSRVAGGGGAGGGGGGGAHRAGAGQDGHTPLHLAADSGHLAVAEKLLAAGAAVGATTEVREGAGGLDDSSQGRGCVVGSSFARELQGAGARGAVGAGALTARAPGRTDTRRCTTLRSAVTWRWRRSCSRRARPSARQPRCATRGAEGLFHDNDVREGLRCFGFCFSFSDGESAGWFLRVARGGGRGGGCWMGCDGGREGGWACMLTRACARGRTA